jgi:hypothetical protein
LKAPFCTADHQRPGLKARMTSGGQTAWRCPRPGQLRLTSSYRGSHSTTGGLLVMLHLSRAYPALSYGRPIRSQAGMLRTTCLDSQCELQVSPPDKMRAQRGVFLYSQMLELDCPWQYPRLEKCAADWKGRGRGQRGDVSCKFWRDSTMLAPVLAQIPGYAPRGFVSGQLSQRASCE